MSANRGRFFEDFRLGEEIRHATPRTVTAGDVSLYTALYGTRFALQSSDAFAQAAGFPRAPVDDLLVFHVVFGKSVPDVSLNAVANLGYAGGVFLQPVFPGDTLSARSEVIGLKENRDGKTGIVYVRTRGFKQDGSAVLDYRRWVMVRKRDEAARPHDEHVPDLPASVAPSALGATCPPVPPGGWDDDLAGSRRRWGDCRPGDRVDHLDAMTVEEAEHQIATRLFQNTARVHFDAHAAASTRFGRRLVYGGHVISLARALSFNDFANACQVAAVNAGRHVAPLFAGDTVFAWSEVREAAELPGRSDVGALRLRTVATKNQPCAAFPDRIDERGHHPAVILDLDYWVLMVR